MELKTGQNLGHEKAKKIETEEDWKRAKAEGEMLKSFLNSNNGYFKGNWERCWALHHCQLFDEPLNLFVVEEQMVGEGTTSPDENERNTYFPAQIIYNPKIVTALPTRIDTYSEEKKDGNHHGKRMAVENRWFLKEGCMSYPKRKETPVPRFVEIKVWYQYESDGVIQEKEEVIDKLKAQVFQHEMDHAYGVDVHHGDGERKPKEMNWEEKYLENGKTYHDLVHEEDETSEEATEATDV